MKHKIFGSQVFCGESFVAMTPPKVWNQHGKGEKKSCGMTKEESDALLANFYQWPRRNSDASESKENGCS